LLAIATLSGFARDVGSAGVMGAGMGPAYKKAAGREPRRLMTKRKLSDQTIQFHSFVKLLKSMTTAPASSRISLNSAGCEPQKIFFELAGRV
jgi:hypothetical protein